ncbi:unnamed protein product [Rhodiola kirilowii]
MSPFVSWSMKNQCLKPDRWVLYHWGELRVRMGPWVQNVMEAVFGKVKVETFGNGTYEGVYCFEKALVMRHNFGKLGIEGKHRVFEQLRCKARRFCHVQHGGRWNKSNERGNPIIRLTMLMRRNTRSFKNVTLVTSIFARECEKVDGCVLKVTQSENLTFCDQVRVLTHTDIVASSHGAQLTNMLFMDRNSSVMEFFPRGWYELAGIGQYAHHWMADISGMKHRGSCRSPGSL